MTFSIRVVVWAVVLMAVPFVASAADWARFQGPPPANIAAEKLPLTWSGTEHVKWSADIEGYGQSSPVVWGDEVFVTSISGPNKERGHVAAFHRKTGHKGWQYDFETASGMENSSYVSKAAPSPAVDAAALYCFFEGGNLFALNHDGKPLWKRDLVKEYGPIESRHGISASLEQNDELLFLWVEREKDPFVLAVDKKSGENKWKVGGIGATSWASPRLVPVEKQSHLVLSGIGKIVGLDPASGKTLWSFDDISGNSTPTPVPLGDGRFLIGATAGRGETTAGKAAESNGLVAIRRKSDGSFQAEFVWKSKRATSSFGSPLAYRGFAYYVNATGVLFCQDLETGEELYGERIGDSIWATPIAIGDRLYFFGKSGKVTVVEAGPKFKQLGESTTWEAKATATPAAPTPGGAPPRMFGGPTLYAAVVLDDQLLLRRGDKLYCIAAKQQ